ncbi:hypothetical protein MXB_1724, partial [Myxobolus squamalis]
MIILALKIIFKLIDYPDFLCQFIKTNGVTRICFVPHCLISSLHASLVLSKIIKNQTFKENIKKNQAFIDMKKNDSLYSDIDDNYH